MKRVAATDRLTDRPPDRRTAGIALLEVLIALAILGSTGLALTGLLREAIAAQVEVAKAERTMRSADRVLVAMTLLNRQDLDRRLGSHPIGEFVVDVQRPQPRLYRLALAERSAPERLLLVTVVHRPKAGL